MNEFFLICFLLFLKKEKKNYYKNSMLLSFSSTFGQNMSPCGQSLLSKQWFCFSVFVWTSMALQTTVLIIKSGHMDLYFTHKYMRMNVAYSFYCKNSCSFSKSKENKFSNVCHSYQPPDSKNTFSPNSSNQNDFFQ